MVLSAELLPYAENIWTQFPEVFLALGTANSENEYQKDKQLLERQLVVTRSMVSIRLALHRQHLTQLEGELFSRFAGHSATEDLAGAQKLRPPRDLRFPRQPCLTEVFNTPKLTDVFNSRKWPQALGSGRKHTGLQPCRHEGVGSAQEYREPVDRHCEVMDMVQASTEAAGVPSRALSPTSTTLGSDGINSPLDPNMPWMRWASVSSSWSDAASAVAMRRGIEHLAFVVTRPPPAPSSSVVRVPALDRIALSQAERGLAVG